MEFFRIHRTIPFMRYALLFNAISLLTFLVAVGSLVTRGLHLSIEFTGGTVMEIAYPQSPDLDRVRQTIEGQGWGDFQVQSFGTSRDVLVRLPLREGYSSGQQAELVFGSLTAASGTGEAAECAALHATYRELATVTPDRRDRTRQAEYAATRDKLGNQCVQLRRVEFVGPQVGQELAYDGLLALGMVVAGIMIYLALRFEWKYAVAAIIANLHDIILVVGMFSIFGWEFSLPVLAAVLATLGYSVNESVIIFDRVREHFRKMRGASVTNVLDSAITATISRTIITHGCTLAISISMLLVGGPALHYFALALTIGILFSIYSSVFVAAAIARWLGVRREDLIKPERRRDEAVV